MACAAVFAAVLLAVPAARAYDGVSIGIGFCFLAFIGAARLCVTLYYVSPPSLLQRPYVS